MKVNKELTLRLKEDVKMLLKMMVSWSN